MFSRLRLSPQKKSPDSDTKSKIDHDFEEDFYIFSQLKEENPITELQIPVVEKKSAWLTLGRKSKTEEIVEKKEEPVVEKYVPKVAPWANCIRKKEVSTPLPQLFTPQPSQLFPPPQLPPKHFTPPQLPPKHFTPSQLPPKYNQKRCRFGMNCNNKDCKFTH